MLFEDHFRIAVRLAMQNATHRSAVRIAMEFDTPEALEEYLRDHPQADKSKHWVKSEKKEPSREDKAAPKKTPSEDKKAPKKPGKPKVKPVKLKPLAKPSAAARVGVGGKEVPPPPKKLPRLDNLRPDEKELEDRANGIFEANPDGAAKAFLEIARKNNWVFETDAGKELLPEWSRPDLPKDEKGKPVHPERAEFRGKYNAVLHQAANAIVKRAFLSRLDEIAKMPPEKRRILVTSGGVAAGKGSVVDSRPDLIQGVSATWDAAGEQNATENEWLMEECRKRGIRPTFIFVATDPITRWPGVISRARGIGRMVDAQLFADSYAVGAKNFHEFHQKYKDDADFIFAQSTMKDKSKLKPGEDPVLVEIRDSMPKEALDLDPHEIYRRAIEYLNEHRDEIPDYIYEGATFGTRAWKD